MARDEYLQHFAAVPLFSQCSKQQLQEIGRVADELTVPAGTVLTRQGDVARELFILVDGTASVTRESPLSVRAGSSGNWR
jgi:CRP/FNR family transcriptional regulator, cyclic AMP receptor protein